MSLLLAQPFLLLAWGVVLGLAMIAPLLGHFILVRRLSLLSDTMAHVALVGVAVGALIGWQSWLLSLAIVMGASLWIDKIASEHQLSGEIILSLFLSGGLALTLVMMSFVPSSNAQLSSYLFGSLVTITKLDVVTIWLLAIMVFITLIVHYRRMLLVIFDPELAAINGIDVTFYHRLLLILVATTISIAMKIVGVLLIGAMMVIPAITAMKLANSFWHSWWLSSVIAAITATLGLLLSFQFNLPTSATIVLVMIGGYVLAAIWDFK